MKIKILIGIILCVIILLLINIIKENPGDKINTTINSTETIDTIDEIFVDERVAENPGDKINTTINSTETIDTIDEIFVDEIFADTNSTTADTTIENATIDDAVTNITNETYDIVIDIKTNDSEKLQIKKTLIKDINAKDAYKLIKENLDNENFVIIDIRTNQEFKAGYIKGAINIDYYAHNFTEQIKKLNKSRAYLIYCKSGGRSKLSLEIFQELNFEQIYHLVDGIESWKYEGFPVEILE